MKVATTCVECGKKGEMETSNPAAVHMTFCAECSLEEMRTLTRFARKSVEHLPDGLPDEATTPKQRELQAKHGTPKAFAEGCIQCVGEISPMEARRAVTKYLAEWNGTEEKGMSGTTTVHAFVSSDSDQGTWYCDVCGFQLGQHNAFQRKLATGE